MSRLCKEQQKTILSKLLEGIKGLRPGERISEECFNFRIVIPERRVWLDSSKYLQGPEKFKMEFEKADAELAAYAIMRNVRPKLWLASKQSDYDDIDWSLRGGTRSPDNTRGDYFLGLWLSPTVHVGFQDCSEARISIIGSEPRVANFL